MSKSIRVIAVLSVIAAAACASSVETSGTQASDTLGQAAHDQIAAMHAAIPAGRNGDVFEYSAQVSMPALEHDRQETQLIFLAQFRHTSGSRVISIIAGVQPVTAML